MSESDLPRWFEEFYAEALRVGVSRSHALSLYERGEVTAANWLAKSRQLQEKAAPGYGIYREQFKTAKSEALKAVGADEEKARGIRALGPVNPMQFSSWPSHLAARWGVGTEAPRHRVALERSEYGEEIIPESHIAWKGREFVYPTSALEASWIGSGRGQITATFPEEKFGKRAAMLGSHERVSITGVPEFRGAMKPGPRAVAPDVYSSMRTAYVIGGEIGTPGTAYMQSGLGHIFSEKTQDVYGEDLRPLPVGTRYAPGQEYSLVEGGRGYESPWWGHEIAGVAPITRERKPGEVEHGYRFHMLQTAPVSGPLTAAIKTASGKHIYQETDLSGVVSARTGESLGIQTLQPIKDPGGVAYEMFMAEYSQATPEQKKRIAQQLGFDPNKPPSYGELAAPVMERFARQASQMVEPAIWKGRAYHESQREMYAPVIQKGSEVAAPDIGEGFYRADMQYQVIRANAGQQLMIEYGAKNSPFVSIEMLEQMRRGGPETQALARQFEGEGARARNAYRELYRTVMASEGQLQLASGKDIGSRNVQDPKIQAAIQEAITGAEAQGPADRYTMAGRFFEGFRQLRGALPIELEGGVQMLSPRYMSWFSATGVLSEQQVAKLQTSAYEALRWSMIPKVGEEVNPAYRAAIDKYQAAAKEIVSGEKFPTRLEGVHLARESSYGGTVFSSPLLREGEAYVPQESMQGKVGYLWGHPMQWGTQTWDEGMQRHFITKAEMERRGGNVELFQAHPTDIQAHARDTDADDMYAKAVAEAQFNEAGQALTTGGAPITNELVNLRAQEAIAAGAGINLAEMVGWGKDKTGQVVMTGAPTTEQAAGIMREAWSKPRRFSLKDAWQQLRSFSALYESIGPRYTTMRNAMAVARSPEEIAAVEAFHGRSHGVSQRPEALDPVMERVHKLRTFTEKGGLFSKQSGVGTTGMAGPGLYALRGAAIGTFLDLAKQGDLTPEQAAAWIAPEGAYEELAGVIRDKPEEAYGHTMQMWGGAGPEGLESFMQGSLAGRLYGPEVAERLLYERQEGGKRRPRTEQEWEAAAMGLGVSPDVARNLLERREEQRAYGEVVGKQLGQRNPLSYLASRAITAARGIIQGSASWLGGGFRTPTDLAGMAMQRAQATAEPAVVQQQTTEQAPVQPVSVGNAEQVAAATKQAAPPAKPTVDIPPDIAKRASRARPSSLDFDPSTPEGRAKLTLSLMGLGGKEAAVGTEAHTQIQAAIKGGRSYMGIPSKQWMAESFVTLEGQGGSLDLYSPENQRIVDIKPGSGSFDPANYAYQMAWYGEAGASEVFIGTYDPVLAHQGKWPEMVDKFLGGTPVKPPPITPEQLKERQAAVLQAQQELAPLAAQLLSGMTDEQRKEFAQKPWAEQQEFVMQAMGGSGGGKGPEPPVAIAAGSLAGGGGEQSGGAGRQPPAGPAWATGAWVGMGKIHELEEAKKQLGLWGKAIARNIVDIEHLDKPTKELVQQFEKWSKTFQDVRTESERMGQRIKEYPGAPEDWLKDIRQRMGRAGGAVTGLEGEAGFGAMQAAMYERGQLEQYRRVFRATGQAPGGGLFLPGEEFAAEGMPQERTPRGRATKDFLASFLEEFSIGGAAIRMGVINRFTGGTVKDWQEQAMPYQQSMLGFQLAMGMPYEEAMQGPVGQMTAYQAAMSRFQTARGVAALQGRIGAQQMFGLYPSEEMGQLMGQVGSPLLSGLGAGLTVGVAGTTAAGLAAKAGLGTLAGVGGAVSSTGLAGGLMGMAGPLALGVGAAVGGGLALGQIYQAGSTSNLQREWSEIAMGQRDQLSVWAKMGYSMRDTLTEEQAAEQRAKIAGVAGGATRGRGPGPVGIEEQLATRQREYEQTYAFRVNNAAVYIENMKELKLGQEQALQLGGLLSMAGITPEQISGGQADRYIRQFAPMMQMGQGEAQMSSLMRFGGYLGVAPGRGLQEYMSMFPGVEQPAEQTRWLQAAQMLGSIGGQAGITPQVTDVRRYADMMQDIPEAQLSLLAREQYGLGGIGMTLGAPAGFSSAFESLLQPKMQGMVGGRTATPGDFGGLPGMQIGGTPKYGAAQLSAEQYMKMQSLTQFGMSQQGYNMMAGGYGLGGPLAQMFGMLEERGMGPGAPTGPALMDAQGYGYGTFERRGINWAQYGLQQRQQEASWEYQQTQNAFQMGDWGGTSSVGWGFGLTGQIQIQQDLMEFTKQIRAITHEMIALQREQSMRGIEYQERGLEMSTRHSLENLGMSRRMWQENTQFSRLQMGVQWGQMETQQGWQMQDMAWNRQMAGFQYEYQQDELERSIRLATGREKQGLLRRREYQEEMYARQEDRRGVEEERAKQVMEWERQKFSLQKEHFERVTQLQEMQFNMQERHILERYALDKEKIEQQKQDMQAIWALEDERRKLQEAWEDRQQQYHLEELERQKRYYEEVVFPYQKQQHDFQLESMKYQAQSMKLQEDIEDAHAKYQAWQIQQYSPGGELYDKVMEFINEIIAALDEAQGAADQTWSNTPPEIPGYNAPYPSASNDLATALFAGLQGASMKLVLDDGKSFDAHIETVQDTATNRKAQAGNWGRPW